MLSLILLFLQDAEGFYSKLVSAGNAESATLVPTIDASQAQATVESDRVRIMAEITRNIGMESFNKRLQEYLEQSLRSVATETLLQRGGVAVSSASGTKATLGLLRGELEQVKHALAGKQEETKQELKQEVLATRREVKEVKEGLEETKQVSECR